MMPVEEDNAVFKPLGARLVDRRQPTHWIFPKVLDKPTADVHEIMQLVEGFELYEFCDRSAAFKTFSKVVENARILPTIFIRQMSEKLKAWVIRDEEIYTYDPKPSYAATRADMQLLIDQMDSLYFQKQIGYVE